MLQNPALAPVLAPLLAQRVALVLVDPHLPDQPVVYASPAFTALTGYTEAEIIGQNCRFLQGADTDAATVAAIRQAVAGGQPISAELLNYRKDGSRFLNLLKIDPVRVGGRLRYFLGVQQEIPLQTQLEDVEADPEILLRDLRHRTDNILQLVLSLLRLRAARLTEPSAVTAMSEAAQRIEALVLIQRYLNRIDGDALVEISKPLGELCLALHGMNEQHRIELVTEPLVLPASKVTPLLLLVNEALTNAVRHAFPDGRAGTVTVSFTAEPDGRQLLVIEDDGIGIAHGSDLLRATSLGSLLMRGFANQLRGELQVTSSPTQGVRLSLRLPATQAQQGRSQQSAAAES